MDNAEHRRFRQEKREKKQAGNQRVRRLFKQDFRRDPSDPDAIVVDYGRYATAPLNGRDHDKTRRNRAGPTPHPDPIEVPDDPIGDE